MNKILYIVIYYNSNTVIVHSIQNVFHKYKLPQYIHLVCQWSTPHTGLSDGIHVHRWSRW